MTAKRKKIPAKNVTVRENEGEKTAKTRENERS